MGNEPDILARPETWPSLPKRGRDARRAGERFYLTGKPCKRGHVAPRYAEQGTCLVCHRTAYCRANAARRRQHQVQRYHERKADPAFLARKRETERRYQQRLRADALRWRA